MISQAHFEWWTPDRVTNPPKYPTLRHVYDAWWVTNADGDVLVWISSNGDVHPQCNGNESLATQFAATYADKGATHATLIPSAFLRDDPGRY